MITVTNNLSVMDLELKPQNSIIQDNFDVCVMVFKLFINLYTTKQVKRHSMCMNGHLNKNNVKPLTCTFLKCV